MNEAAANVQLDAVEMRQAYSSAVYELAQENADIVALEADLMSSISMDKIKRRIPEQVINCGVMEANMIGIAAGLSLTGRIPFVHTFAQFATRRCFDQLFVSGAYAKTNIKILGSDSGITAEHNGGTHMAFEDLGLARLIPNAFVYEASDAAMLQFLIKKAAAEYGIHYIRTIRKKAVRLYDEHETFADGKAKVLKDGSDAALFASGIMVAEALQAAELLKEKGIDAAVIDMYCIKPIDQETVIRYAQKTKAIVTAENHNVIGGLGSAVAEVLSEHYPAPLKRIGVHEAFGQVGTIDYLKKYYRLTAEHIARAAEQLV
ncbi:transketolase family protein [Bacillus paralicheniformis]|uniref:transketolase family protein n=1 Tax=Bacillus paralicheniformis TaxID=1648923 RepID=UPI00128B6B49|nr:transketolase C-terminal domain-containing protein [Bacillus paralicheniformis]MPQ25584.1 transketolase family protein [Bacillus paralicheniformis]